MAILSIYEDFAGQAGVNPRLIRMVSDDTLATITTAGYLNSAINQGFTFLPTDVIFINYAPNNTSGIFSVSISGTVYTLVQTEGAVSGPTVPNHVAVFKDVNGTIEDGVTSAATALLYGLETTQNGVTALLGNITATSGDLIAGSSGFAGKVISYPATAANGTFVFQAVNNVNNFASTLNNSAVGQATVYSLPDPSIATTRIILGNFNGAQTITSAAVDVVLNLVGDASGVGGADHNQLVIKTATYTNRQLILGYSQIGSYGGIQAVDQGVGVTPLMLNAAGGVVNIGASGNGFPNALQIYSAGASLGSLYLQPLNAAGDFISTINTNGTLGQATTYTLPDPLVSTTSFVCTDGHTTMGSTGLMIFQKANGTESGGLVTASGQAGVITTSSLTTAGGSTYTITWTNTKILPSSSILLTLSGGSSTIKNVTLEINVLSGVITIHNNSASPLDGTLLISYFVA